MKYEKPAGIDWQSPSAGGSATRQSGTALVETALTLPLFLGVLLAGVLFGYIAYARIALTLAVHETARAFAGKSRVICVAEGVANTFFDKELEVYYGLDKTRVQVLTLCVPLEDNFTVPIDNLPKNKDDPLNEDRVLVVACYALPFALPDFDGLFQPRSLVDQIAAVGAAEEALHTAQQTASETRRRTAAAKDMTQKADYLRDLYVDLKGSSRLLKAQAIEVVVEEVLGFAMRWRCGRDGSHAISAQAVVRVEPPAKAR